MSSLSEAHRVASAMITLQLVLVVEEREWTPEETALFQELVTSVPLHDLVVAMAQLAQYALILLANEADTRTAQGWLQEILVLAAGIVDDGEPS